MDNHPIENLMKSTMENIKDMIDVNTIVGDAVESKDGSLIIPISKVSFGFASGGSEFSSIKKENCGDDSKYPFGGGSGAGVSLKPVAFLVIKNDTIRLLNIDAENTVERVIDSVPQIMDLMKSMFKDNKKDCKSKDKANTNSTMNECCPNENKE